MRLAPLFGATWVILFYWSAAADLPAPDQQLYRNLDYQFSVQLPRGFLACIGEITNHGIAILLEPHSGCNGNYFEARAIFVNGNSNAAGDADTTWGLAAIQCRYRLARHILWLRGERLSGHKAAGCRRDFSDGHIEVSIFVLRKTERSYLQWEQVSADLSTTPSHYRADMRVFRRVLRGIWVHPDGPMR
jgi:hypothetical protein